MQFFVQATQTLTAAPFSLGYAFRQGDVPAGSSLGSGDARLQVQVRNRWPDGSLKFALLSGELALEAGKLVAVRLNRSGVQASGTAIGLAELKRTGLVAEVSCGAFGNAVWRDTDWDAPFQTWVSGPLMSSWVFRKPVGADAHLTAWLELRLYASGALELLPWVENGYLLVAGPTNKSANYSFSLNGTQRFSALIDLKHHQRTPLIRGNSLSYWLGTDPEVALRHDALYLQSTELVPSYYARMPASAAALARLSASYEPLQAGDFRYDGDSMAASGYQEPIGLLPQHDTCYLVADVGNTYAAVVRNGYSAGRYPIHYRDESTQRPPRFSQRPNLVLADGSGFKDNGSSTRNQRTPSISGTLPPTWDIAHSPSVGFLAYLLTGRWYFMEEVQFAATTNYLGNGDNALLREGSLGIVKTSVQAWQTRSCAWNWRSLVQALCVTPDDDTSGLREEFVRSVEANISHFHARYVAQPNNPFGWILPGETYNNSLQFGACWQQDFVTAAFGYSLGLRLPIANASQQQLTSFFAWKAQSVVRRLGERSGFWYINGAPFTMSISPAAVPDYAGGRGPWYSSDAEVYAATYASPPSWLGATEGTLAGEFMPGERAMWGNLMPALAYAVRHGAPGALSAYNRVQSARNWPALRDAFNVNPVWGVRPSVQQPTWLQGQPLNRWIEIPGTSGAGGSAIDAYSGMAYNEGSNEILIAAAGGHNDAADNRVVSLRLTDDAPKWQLRMASSTETQRDVAYYSDGKPSSRHIYQSMHYVPQVNRLIHFGLRAAFGNAFNFAKVDAFNLDTNTWDPQGTWADAPPGEYGACLVRATGELWTTNLKRWSPRTRTWDAPITQRTRELVRWPMSHDSRRNQLFVLQWGEGQGFDGQLGMQASRVPLSGNQQFSVTFRSSPALTQWLEEKPTYAAMDYDPDNDRFLFYSGQGAAAGRVYAIQIGEGSEPWDMSLLAVTPGITPVPVRDSGVHNRFRYVPALKGFVLLARRDANLYFLRTA
jgi:hypothetical protein